MLLPAGIQNSLQGCRGKEHVWTWGKLTMDLLRGLQEHNWILAEWPKVVWGRIEVDQGTHKPQGPAGSGTSSSGRADLGPATGYLASLGRASESSSWNNQPIVHTCVLQQTSVLMSWRGRAGWSCPYMCESCVFMGWWQRLCSEIVPAGIRASQLWACDGRIFPGSWSPLESAAIHRSMAAPTFKLCLLLILVLDKETSDLTSTVRAATVLGPRICSYQAGSSSPWEQSSCELWMHRVCLRPSESGSAPSPRSHTHLSDSFWQHPLLTSSPSPLPSGYLEYRKTQQIVMNSLGCIREISHFLRCVSNAKNCFCLISDSLLLKDLVPGWFICQLIHSAKS